MENQRLFPKGQNELHLVWVFGQYPSCYCLTMHSQGGPSLILPVMVPGSDKYRVVLARASSVKIYTTPPDWLWQTRKG